MHTKKTARALAAAALAVVLTTGTAFASVGTATVTADALRLRSQASTSSATLTTVYKGSSVELLSEEENGWYKVNYNGREGYMAAEWLKVNTVASTDSPSDAAAETGTVTEPDPVTEPDTTTETGASAETGAVPVVNAGPLNVRSGPGTGYDRVGSLNKGAEVTILEAVDGWYKVSAGNVVGYVSAQYISLDGTVEQEGLVLQGPLNVRSGPGTGYARVGSLSVGTTVTILGSENGWYQISTGSLTGYVSADYVTPLEDIGSSPVGAAAAALAMSLIGKSYSYGAVGPNSFDCSGLMQYIYKQLGYSITRTSSSQYNNDGDFVSLSSIEPGDLVFFFDSRFDGSGGTLPTTHVGIYVGNGQFVHASTTTYRVQTDNLYGSYYTPHIVGVKRIG